MAVVGRLGEGVCLKSFGKGFIGRPDRISFGARKLLDWIGLGVGPGVSSLSS